jgi:hypothetical protein
VSISIPTSLFANQFNSNSQDGLLFLNGPLVSIYSGDKLPALSLVASNSALGSVPGYYGSSAGPLLVRTNLTFKAVAGSSYAISVDGCNGSEGSFDISLQSDIYAAFFDGQVSLGSGWYYLSMTNQFFGYYLMTDYPYVYHMDLGWEYFIDAHNGEQGAYVYDFQTGHFWYTSPQLLPNLYDFSLQAWLYYFPDTTRIGHYTTDPRYFYDFGNKTIITQ